MKRMFILAIMCGVCFASVASADRKAPDKVAPVEHDGVQYVVVHWGSDNGTGQNGGYIEARDKESKKKVWGLQVYKTVYDKRLERDVQDVFIKSMKLDESLKLIVLIDERNRVYHVDIAGRKVVPEQKPANLTGVDQPTPQQKGDKRTSTTGTLYPVSEEKDVCDISRDFKEVARRDMTGLLDFHYQGQFLSEHGDLSIKGQRHRLNIDKAQLQKALGRIPARGEHFLFPATVTTKYMKRRLLPQSYPYRHIYATDVRELAVPYGLKTLRAYCAADFEKRFKASHPSAVLAVEKALRTDKRIKDEDRNRDAAALMKAVSSRDPGGAILPSEAEYELAAGRSRNAPSVLWEGVQSGFSIACTDWLSVSYTQRMSPKSSWAPRSEQILGPKRHLSVAYDFGPQGDLQRVRVYCPACPEARSLPVTEDLLATRTGKIPKPPRSKLIHIQLLDGPDNSNSNAESK